MHRRCSCHRRPPEFCNSRFIRETSPVFFKEPMYNLPAHARRLRTVQLEHLPGFPSLSRHHLEASTRLTCVRRHESSRAPVGVPSATFCTSSTACSDPRLAGLFHPAATSGIPPSGVFPRVKPTDSSPAFTLMSLTTSDCRKTTVAHNQAAPALMISPSGSCSSHGYVVNNWGFSPTTHPIPSWVFLLRASLRTRPG